MKETELLKECVKEMRVYCLEEKLSKTALSEKQINRRRKNIKEIIAMCLDLQERYKAQAIGYITMKASSKAIKANEERRELVKQILSYCSELDAKLAIKGAMEKAAPSLTFTIYN